MKVLRAVVLFVLATVFSPSASAGATRGNNILENVPKLADQLNEAVNNDGITTVEPVIKGEDGLMSIFPDATSATGYCRRKKLGDIGKVIASEVAVNRAVAILNVSGEITQVIYIADGGNDTYASIIRCEKEQKKSAYSGRGVKDSSTEHGESPAQITDFKANAAL